MRTALTAAACAAACTAFGQSFWEPEVRRAEPVRTPDRPPAAEPANPAWMEHVPQAQPVAPESTPAPTPEDAPDSIRLRPTEGIRDEAAEQLEKANSIYARKMYEFAAMEYEKFLDAYPDAPGRDAALFRLGESYRVDGKPRKARDAYERLVAGFHEGDFLGAGAYRLGEMLLAEAKYAEALARFEQAAAHATEAEVRLSARYQSGRCLDRLGKSREAAAVYEEVGAAEGKNPYRDHARLAHADALAESGEKERALAAYEAVAEGAAHPAMRAEAQVKAGALAATAGEAGKARALFEGALKLGDGNPWKSAATLGVLRLEAATGNHEAAAATADAGLGAFKGDARAEALALAGDAHRQLGRSAKAAGLYTKLIEEFPDSEFAARSRFPRVVALHEAGDKQARREIEKFLAGAPPSADRERASLLLAEVLFAEGDFAGAAPLYAAADGEGLTEAMRKQALYKQGWCLARIGKAEQAAAVFTRFIEAHPEDQLAGPATLQRGIARQQLKDYAGAVQDFDTVIERWPGAGERQAAMLQKALTLGQRDDRAGMKEAFLKLLEAYPKSEAAAQAEYWIGWAAFEEKDYAGAAPRFARARELDPAGFGERAGLRLALCHYYAGDRGALVAEMKKLPDNFLPKEVVRWAGLRSAQEGDFAAAEALLASTDKTDGEAQVTLAEARLALGKHAEALPAAQAALAATQEPAPRARCLLAIAEAKRGLRQFDEAVRYAEEALLLQPEGRLNAAGRMTTGEIEFGRGDFDAAARAFMTVALLYDEATITPRALERAADSYRRANNDAEAEKALEELRRRYPDNASSQSSGRTNS